MSIVWMGMLRPARVQVSLRMILLVVSALATVSCSQVPFTFTASAPWSYSAAVDPPFERVAILVTITNQSGDDLPVNPADFVVRDADHRVYPSDPAAAVADASAVRHASATQRGVQSVEPLPTITLRQDDVVSGFVVFDVPAGVRLVELIWRQSDSDYVAPLAPAR